MGLAEDFAETEEGLFELGLAERLTETPFLFFEAEDIEDGLGFGPTNPSYLWLW